MNKYKNTNTIHVWHSIKIFDITSFDVCDGSLCKCYPNECSDFNIINLTLKSVNKIELIKILLKQFSRNKTIISIFLIQHPQLLMSFYSPIQIDNSRRVVLVYDKRLTQIMSLGARAVQEGGPQGVPWPSTCLRAANADNIRTFYLEFYFLAREGRLHDGISHVISHLSRSCR